jgi:hypothetical protein
MSRDRLADKLEAMRIRRQQFEIGVRLIESMEKDLKNQEERDALASLLKWG